MTSSALTSLSLYIRVRIKGSFLVQLPESSLSGNDEEHEGHGIHMLWHRKDVLDGLKIWGRFSMILG